ACGGLTVGLLVAYWTRGLLIAVNPVPVKGLSQLAMDGRVLVFTAICALLTGIVFGIAPALVSTRISSAAAGGDRRRRRWLQSLAGAELALAMVLLTGAG